MILTCTCVKPANISFIIVYVFYCWWAGDVHCQFPDRLRLFEHGGYPLAANGIESDGAVGSWNFTDKKMYTKCESIESAYYRSQINKASLELTIQTDAIERYRAQQLIHNSLHKGKWCIGLILHFQYHLCLNPIHEYTKGTFTFNMPATNAPQLNVHMSFGIDMNLHFSHFSSLVLI